MAGVWAEWQAEGTGEVTLARGGLTGHGGCNRYQNHSFKSPEGKGCWTRVQCEVGSVGEASRGGAELFLTGVSKQ